MSAQVVVKGIGEENHATLVATNLHQPFNYAQGTDPGAVGAGLWWYNTTTTSVSVRDATNTSWITVTGGVGAYGPASAKYIVQQPDGTLSAEQALSALATGILKSTTTTGVLSIATGADLPTHTHAEADVTSLVTDLSNKQALNANLTSISGITAVNDDVIQRKAGAWTNRTMAQVKTDLVLVKGDVGLGNVDNTSDATKNSAVATLTNKTLTSPAITTPTGLVKGDVGLGNVDNTSDATKNSAAATLSNKILTTPTINSYVNATHDHSNASGGGQIILTTGISGMAAGVATFLGTPSSANLKAAVTDETGSGALVFATSPALVTPTGIVKGDVGLSNVDNTSDATQNAAAVTLTNKTLDITNTATFKDTQFTLVDDVDTTKKAVFQLSALSSGGTRTYTLPDSSSTIITGTGTATLSNKTLDNTTNISIADSSLTLQAAANSTKHANFDISAVPASTSVTYTMPGASSSILTTAGSQTLSNKTFDSTCRYADHIITSGTSPTITVQTAAGTTATASVVGNDMAGRITLTPGGTGIATGNIFLFNFTVTAPSSNYSIVLSPGSSAARTLGGVVGYSTGNTVSITIATGTALTSGSSYIWHYVIMFY